jgi:hypothetical protein
LRSSSDSSVCWEWQSSSTEPAIDVGGLPLMFGSGEPDESNWEIRSTYRCEPPWVETNFSCKARIKVSLLVALSVTTLKMRSKSPRSFSN